jgi:hypothetical protein
MVSCVPTTGIYWHPVHFYAVESCIGAQDNNQTSEDWHTGFSWNAIMGTLYTVQIAPLRIPNWNLVLSTGRKNENRLY